jgi:hypothetical protein
MLTPQRLLTLLIEIIFVLLGLLVVWLGLTGHIFFNRHKVSWLLLSVAIIVWGVRGIYRKPGSKPAALEDWVRALSLALLGLVLLAMTRVPFLWVGPMLACAGLLLTVRGIVGSVLLLRPANLRR